MPFSLDLQMISTWKRVSSIEISIEISGMFKASIYKEWSKAIDFVDLFVTSQSLRISQYITILRRSYDFVRLVNTFSLLHFCSCRSPGFMIFMELRELDSSLGLAHSHDGPSAAKVAKINMSTAELIHITILGQPHEHRYLSLEWYQHAVNVVITRLGS